jgi:hypothetical protein
MAMVIRQTLLQLVLEDNPTASAVCVALVTSTVSTVLDGRALVKDSSLLVIYTAVEAH